MTNFEKRHCKWTIPEETKSSHLVSKVAKECFSAAFSLVGKGTKWPSGPLWSWTAAWSTGKQVGRYVWKWEFRLPKHCEQAGHTIMTVPLYKKLFLKTTQTHIPHKDNSRFVHNTLWIKWCNKASSQRQCVLTVFWKMLTGVNLPTALICAGDWAGPWVCGTCTWGVCCSLGGWTCVVVMVFPGSGTPVAGRSCCVRLHTHTTTGSLCLN